jgi:hypothetical protein
MKTICTSILLLLCTYAAIAQKNTDVIATDKPITWLGLDFTMARFIGEATQFKEAGEITTSDMKDKYFPGWNNLFINEEKKYNVAKYVNRESVSHAPEVTEAANNKVTKAFFSDSPDDYSRLSEADITGAVKKYNFKGRKGVGLLFFVEGMSKGKAKASAWVTFVDMGTKAVLETRRVTGDAGGIGFRNYWAKAFLDILKKVD